jgi:hypothetical protein
LEALRLAERYRGKPLWPRSAGGRDKNEFSMIDALGLLAVRIEAAWWM